LYCLIRGCHATLDFADELRIMDYIQEHEGLSDASKWAFIVDSELLCNIGHTGGLLVSVSKLPIEFAVFQTPPSTQECLPLSRKLMPSIDYFLTAMSHGLPANSYPPHNVCKPIYATARRGRRMWPALA
jgi:hypothetical protein